MIPYFFKTVYRTFLNDKLNFIINIFGLAVGLSLFILISLYVNYETNWDTYHKDYKNIFLLNQVRNYSGQDQYFDQTPGGIASGLKEQIPEILNAACIKETGGEVLSSSEEQSIYDQYGYYADNSIFEILSFEFLAGDPLTALSDPQSIVFTESLARKHFGHCDVLGKTINTDNKSYMISAIVRDMPLNSHFETSYLIPLSVYKEKFGQDLTADWEKTHTRTLIQLRDNEQKDIVSKMAAQIINEHLTDPERKCSVLLEPISELHLGKKANGYYYIIVIYSFLGFLVLILSAINFLNLSTSQSSIRTKEIGVKKVLGSKRGKLATQFLAESVSNSLLALLLAFGIAEFILPLFRIITDRMLVIDYLGNWEFILFVLISTIVVGLLSGLYPAFYLSKFDPVRVLKFGTTTSKKHKRFSFKKGLIIFQFIVSIAFIIGTIGFFANTKYLLKKDVGFEKEGILFTTIKESENLNIKDIESLRNYFLQNPEIENVAMSSYVPFNGQGNKYIKWEGAQENEKIRTDYNYVSDQFLDTYKVPVVKGRNISYALASDSLACVVNETFVKRMAWDDPIGKKIDGNKYTIVGVFQDFHVSSLVNPIEPYMLTRHGGALKNRKILSFKLKAGSSDNTSKAIHEKLQEVFPDNYFEMSYMAGNMDNNTIQTLINVAKTMMYFSSIASLIALVGLFSLVSFSIKRRVKEIGIRKIMGASVLDIYLYLSKEFIILLLISNILAVPLGLMLIKAVPFAYTPEFNIIPIICIVIISFIVTLGSISYWVLKTARANPVESLRYE